VTDHLSMGAGGLGARKSDSKHFRWRSTLAFPEKPVQYISIRQSGISMSNKDNCYKSVPEYPAQEHVPVSIYWSTEIKLQG